MHFESFCASFMRMICDLGKSILSGGCATSVDISPSKIMIWEDTCPAKQEQNVSENPALLGNL